MTQNKISRGNASQFFVAGELCRRGHSAVVTLGNCPNVDILCSNKAGTKFAHIQVKTFLPGNTTCNVGKKAEINFGNTFFWVLAGIPHPDMPKNFVYYVIPAKIMAENVAKTHREWLATPGKKGQAHNDNDMRNVQFRNDKNYYWDVKPYENKWELIDAVLR